MSYTHYTLEERKYLQDLLEKGYSFRKIANYLGRSPSSVSREVKRNRSKKPKNGKSNNKYCYHSWRAQILTILRRKSSRHYRIKSHTEEWNYIIWGLSQFWTPEEVAFRWRQDYPLNKIFGVSTVYGELSYQAQQKEAKSSLYKATVFTAPQKFVDLLNLCDYNNQQNVVNLVFEL